MKSRLNRRNALMMGALATASGLWSALYSRAEVNTNLQLQNKAVVERWFSEFRGETCNLSVVDELAAPDMVLRYSLHKPRYGREDIKAFMHASFS